MSLSMDHPFSGSWRIESEIGRGSYGTVYRVADRSGSFAALKCIGIPNETEQPLHGASIQQLRSRYSEQKDKLLAEVTAMKQLEGNPYIVHLTDYRVIQRNDGYGWDIYILMELLNGLRSCVSSMTVRDAWQLGCDICHALQECAKYNIVHRDIKPDNLFRDDSGHYKLGDFGVARQLSRSMTHGQGTPLYMAPEVIGNGHYGYVEASATRIADSAGNTAAHYDQRADLYSLGIVLYELLNGQCIPFLPASQKYLPSAEDKAYERRIHGQALPIPLQLKQRPVFTYVIQKATAFFQNDRYGSAEEMLAALRSIPAAELTSEPLLLPEEDSMDNTSASQKTKAAWENLQQAYDQAVSAMNEARSAAQFRAAAKMFEEISGYKDAQTLMSQCIQKAAGIPEYQNKNSSWDQHQSSSPEQMEADYQKAKELCLAEPLTELNLATAERLFSALGHYKNSVQLLAQIQQLRQEVRRLEKKRQQAHKWFSAAAMTVIIFLIILFTVFVLNGFR